jgi:hypothetical protein
LVIDPCTGNFLVSDEYGPSLYEFNRRGIFVGAFETPPELVPRPAGVLDYVAGRDSAASGLGRQDNRGFEGVAISPDGMRLFATLQDRSSMRGPDPTPPTRGERRVERAHRTHSRLRQQPAESALQAERRSVYPLEPQLALRTGILSAGGSATETDPRQGAISVCAPLLQTPTSSS